MIEDPIIDVKGIVVRQRFSDIQRQIAASQYDLDYVEYRIIRKDGEIRWIEDYGHYIHIFHRLVDFNVMLLEQL